MFNSAPLVVITALSERAVPAAYAERFQASLTADYRAWVSETRCSNRSYFKLPPMTLKQLVKHFGTKHALCVLLCVQASLLENALKGKPSRVITDALFEVGYEWVR